MLDLSDYNMQMRCLVNCKILIIIFFVPLSYKKYIHMWGFYLKYILCGWKWNICYFLIWGFVAQLDWNRVMRPWYRVFEDEQGTSRGPEPANARGIMGNPENVHRLHLLHGVRDWWNILLGRWDMDSPTLTSIWYRHMHGTTVEK